MRRDKRKKSILRVNWVFLLITGFSVFPARGFSNRGLLDETRQLRQEQAMKKLEVELLNVPAFPAQPAQPANPPTGEPANPPTRAEDAADDSEYLQLSSLGEKNNPRKTCADARLYYIRGVLYYEEGMYEDAQREFLTCLKLDADTASAHYNLGVLYDDKLRKYGLAIRHYKKYLELKPLGQDAYLVESWIFNAEQKKRLGLEVR